MAENLTPEQVRAAKLAAMPAPLGELHHTLYNELAWLHLKWQDFRALFANSEQTVELLNQTAPIFFHHLQRALWEDVLRHLCRLTDPPKSAGRDNLTLLRLPDMIPDLKLRRQADSLVSIADQKTKFARDWRNCSPRRDGRPNSRWARNERSLTSTYVVVTMSVCPTFGSSGTRGRGSRTGGSTGCRFPRLRQSSRTSTLC